MNRDNEKLARLLPVVQKLDEETEALNDDITGRERELNEANVAVTAWLEKNILDDCIEEEKNKSGYGTGQFRYQAWELGFTKVASEWRIAARQKRYVMDNNYNTIGPEVPMQTLALRDAPRHVRMAAAPHLDDLLDALHDTMVRYVSDIQQARFRAEGKQ